MSESIPETNREHAERRCPNCDSVVPPGASLCVMCGAEMVVSRSDSATVTEEVFEPAADPQADEVFAAPIFESKMREKQSTAVSWLTGFFVIIIVILGLLVLRNQDPVLSLALVPTLTSIPPTPSYTPTMTLPPTHTPLPTNTPTLTPSPLPTDTPRPPRFHTVAAGESFFGISFLYRVTADSIAAENDFTLESSLFEGQQIAIPWPTATPPLESMLLQINDDTVIADVKDCQLYALEEGDSVFGLAGKFDVPAEAIVAVNRMTDETIQYLQPGDVFCIPRIVYSDALPPTPGPTPTATATGFPGGPTLLYPLNGAVIDPENPDVALQWVAVKDLAADEYYMIELVDLDVLDGLPYRGFTRDNSFKIPFDWRPALFEPETHDFRWRVSIVQVNGQRADGGFIYRYGGQNSGDATFSWLSATPTPTPTATPTATPETENAALN